MSTSDANTVRFNLRAAQATAVGAAFTLSRGMTSISLLAIPAILRAAPSTAAIQFERMYAIGLVTQPPFSLATSLLFAYIARRHYVGRFSAVITDNSMPTWQLYALAGTAVGAAIPYTYMFMERTSQGLLTMARDSSQAPGDGALKLVKRWGWTNAVRSNLPLLGGIFGIWALIR